MNNAINHLLKFAIVATVSASAIAAPDSPDRAYRAELAYLEKKAPFSFDNPACRGFLNRNWSRFTGLASQYQQLEQEYMNGANRASLCGIQKGYAMYIWMSYFEDVRYSQQFAGKGLQVQLREATNKFMQTRIDVFEDFIHNVNCNANTPRINSVGGQFTQTVHVSCSTSLGPAIINLENLHISVGGKDIWNGPRDEYLGKSFWAIYRQP
ncbi:hypothetical protein [Quatrionicoccus australiensis]|uniref:hypothetical protein n=1 Tax=Quatrionicoccus australiensis TaxID=138118 RepID=UPI001CFB9A51|nr:hypothetical protein [Quatrionicoccus australiensis]MCB4360708.1 hypothetical protein [Quatrionicoccus australiensis]